MNNSEIVAVVQAKIARTTAQITTGIPIWINASQRRICSLYNFSFMETHEDLLVSETHVDLPDGFKDMISVLMDSSLLYPLDIETAQRYYGDSVSADNTNPLFYSLVSDRKIWFFPGVSVTTNYAKIHYYGYLSILTGDNDENYITDNLPELLIEGALVEGFGYLQEWTDAKNHEDKFNKLLIECVTRDRKLTEADFKTQEESGNVLKQLYTELAK